MAYIGDILALGVLLILCASYFENRYVYTATGRCFAYCMLLSIAVSVLDIAFGLAMESKNMPLFLKDLISALFFGICIITSANIAMYLFAKILEHLNKERLLRRARNVLQVSILIYLAIVICNVKTGWLFQFNEAGEYIHGPFYGLGYLFAIFQMLLVLVCYFINRKNTGKAMRRALLGAIITIILCFCLSKLLPYVKLNGFVMAIMGLILFVNFQGNRNGVHTLTKLNDRARFFLTVEDKIQKNEKFQILTVNLKRFAAINKKLGNRNGDEVLYRFAFDLEKMAESGAAFHMNGTVFSMVLPCAGIREADRHTQILMDYLSRGLAFHADHYPIDYVVTDYIYDEEDYTANEVYERIEYAAELAYANKDNYIRYSSEIGEKMRRRQYLIDRLRVVDRKHGYMVYYQPVYAMQRDNFCTAEALLRVREPDGSFISPGELIPVAEQMGMIEPITWFVIQETCRFLGENPDISIQAVSVNLPMHQLQDDSFLPDLNRLTAKYGVPHEKLRFEFTERTVLDDFAMIKTLMTKFTDEGYRFYLDDFGTGYSNFNSLLRLPFASIKLDVCITREVLNEENDAGMVGMLTTLFHNMGMTVIAEGAEEKPQVDALKANAVDSVQGYYFAKPMDEKRVLEFLKEFQESRAVTV